ncbi:MAG: glutathione synthase [Bradymonadia bacterium]
MRVLVIMDPIHTVHPDKDTSFGFILAAQARGHEVFYCQAEDLYITPGEGAGARCAALTVRHQLTDFFDLGEWSGRPLSDFHTIWMRKDPPVDWVYLHATYILDQAPASTLVVNRPSATRGANEKLYALNWPEFCPETLVTRDAARITAWLAQGQPLIAKPVDGHGGAGIFLLSPGDRNVPSIIETLTEEGRRWIIVQAYLPAAREGDKRIILINGEPMGAILRVPQDSDHRGNMHVGGSAVAVDVTDDERKMCATLAPKLREDGLYFVGLDVIGGKMTEINVTSPTGIREIQSLGGPDLGDAYVKWIEGVVG